MRETKTHSQEGPTVALSFTTGPFSGIIFKYSKVQLLEKEGEAYLKFDYDILEKTDDSFDTKAFEQELGDHLLDLLQQGIAENSIVYTGGIDDTKS